MKCPQCGAEVLKGQEVVSIKLSDGSGLDILVTAEYCGECDDYCEIDTELA